MKHAYASSFSSGAVSLFSVVFAVLLMSVVTISFVRIMVDDRSRASDADLSQSAYDSAQAGVEDAKRALIWCKTNSTQCTVAGYDKCNAVILKSGVVKVGASSSEIKVQSVASTDAALDQAYTCVTIEKDTEDYKGQLTANESAVIPLIANKAFNSVTIEWFNRDDVESKSGTVDTPSTATQPLLDKASWTPNRPSIMRTQFMQTGSGFKLSDFDSTTDSGQSNANTLFLYPQQAGYTAADMTTYDIRQDSTGKSSPDSASNTPIPARCKTSVVTGGYACKMTLNLPAPVGGGGIQVANLRLTAFYNATHYRVTLGDGSADAPKFFGVQANVDSTGRASDLYRRIESRVDLYDTSFPYPEAAVDVANSFCKNFGVTDKSYEGSPTYVNNDTACKP
jgi:hypothetical protein